MIFLVIATIFNIWIWKLLVYSSVIALLNVISTLLLFFVLNKLPRSKVSSFKQGSNKYKKHLSCIFLISFIILLYSQMATTKAGSLTVLNNDQIRIKDMRLKSYPPVYIKIGTKTIWIPIAHWFEERKETIAFFRIQKNLSENLDPNLYFFANHPRERIGYKEFDKFPYIFIPFFILGIIESVKLKNRNILYFSLFAPLLLTSIIGNVNPMGPFSLFPFFSINIALGLRYITEKYRDLNLLAKKLGVLFFIIFTLFIFIQMIIYAKS